MQIDDMVGGVLCPQPPSSRPGVTMARQGGDFNSLLLMRECGGALENIKFQAPKLRFYLFSKTSTQNILSPPSHQGGISDRGEDVFLG